MSITAVAVGTCPFASWPVLLSGVDCWASVTRRGKAEEVKRRWRLGAWQPRSQPPAPTKAELMLSRPFSQDFLHPWEASKMLVAVVWTKWELWGSGACPSPCDPVQLSTLESSGRGWTVSSPWSPPALTFSDSVTLGFQSSWWLLEFWQWSLSKPSDLERMT